MSPTFVSLGTWRTYRCADLSVTWLRSSFDASLAGDTTPVVLSKARRYALLFCFSAANYFDSFGSSSTTIALSRISNDLGLSSAEASESHRSAVVSQQA